MEELQKRHRQEQRELQSRITQKKKNASKKTRKGVNDECAELERALQERQQRELHAMNPEAPELETENSETGEIQDIDEKYAKLADGATDKLQQSIQDLQMSPTAEKPASEKRPNRQKARLARRAAEQAAATEAAAAEAAHIPDRRAAEREKMSEEIEKRGLMEKDIRSDGHCLYAAIADQLEQRGVKLEASQPPAYKAVRHKAADVIEEYPDDFVPFLEEPLDQYLAKVRDTGEWGGQLELSALARAYNLSINVLQGDGRVERITSDELKESQEIWLAYYRHSFGLGEHYNSLRPKR